MAVLAAHGGSGGGSHAAEAVRHEYAMLEYAADGPATAMMQFHRATTHCHVHAAQLFLSACRYECLLFTVHSHRPTCLSAPRGLGAVDLLHARGVKYLCPIFAGPGKCVVLFDEEGTEETVVFDNRRTFERWAATHDIALVLRDGRDKYINTWEALQDGGRYFIHRSLQKTVRSANLPDGDGTPVGITWASTSSFTHAGITTVARHTRVSMWTDPAFCTPATAAA